LMDGWMDRRTDTHLHELVLGGHLHAQCVGREVEHSPQGIAALRGVALEHRNPPRALQYTPSLLGARLKERLSLVVLLEPSRVHLLMGDTFCGLRPDTLCIRWWLHGELEFLSVFQPCSSCGDFSKGRVELTWV